MKIKIMLAFVLLGFSGMLLAQGQPGIVVVDARAAIVASNAAQKELEKIKAQLAQEETDIIALRNEIQRLEEAYKKDGAIMSQEERRRAERAIQDKVAEFKFLGERYQKSSQEAQQELLEKMLPRFERALKNLQDEKKYGLIMHKEAVLRASAEYDVTELIIEQMNKLEN